MPHTFSRRDLLAGSAAVLAGNAAFGKPAGEKNVPFKLGVASYSLRKLSRADALRALETLKVKYVNIKEFHAPIKGTPEEWKQARRDFENAGITILGVGNISMAKNDEGEIRRNFEYAKTLGAPLIVMAPSHETVPIIEKFVKEYNIKGAIHNHGPEDKHFPAPKDVLDAVKGRDKRMGLCLDVGHTARTGADVLESVRTAGKEGRLLDMHMKDLADMMVSKSQVAVGEGKMPVRDIFAELIRQKYNGGVMLEYEINADNPVPGMQKSFEYMRRVLAEMKS
jgi:sugar phosphate isomerase/epimerase